MDKIYKTTQKKGSANKWIIFLIIAFLVNAWVSFKDGNIPDSGSHLNAVLIIIIGRSLYTRTKLRKLGSLVKGPKIIDYSLLLFLLLSFPTYFFYEIWLRWPLNFVAIIWSLLAYFYLIFFKKNRK